MPGMVHPFWEEEGMLIANGEMFVPKNQFDLKLDFRFTIDFREYLRTTSIHFEDLQYREMQFSDESVRRLLTTIEQSIVGTVANFKRAVIVIERYYDEECDIVIDCKPELWTVWRVDSELESVIDVRRSDPYNPNHFHLIGRHKTKSSRLNIMKGKNCVADRTAHWIAFSE